MAHPEGQYALDRMACTYKEIKNAIKFLLKKLQKKYCSYGLPLSTRIIIKYTMQFERKLPDKITYMFSDLPLVQDERILREFLSHNGQRNSMHHLQS